MRRTLTFFTLLFCILVEAQIKTRLLNPLPDQARDDAVGFAIDGIGYIQGGRKVGFAISDQLWAYDPAIDTWEVKSSLPGIQRQYASSFILDGQAYLVGGAADPDLRLDEVWRYDPTLDQWTQRANFPDGGRSAMISFVLDGIAYAGLGRGVDSIYNDLWAYDPTTDGWEEVLNFPFGIHGAVSFPLDGKVIIGTGRDENDELTDRMWSFDGLVLEEENSYPQAITSAEALTVDGSPLLVGGGSDSDDAIDGFGSANKQLSTIASETISWTMYEGLAGGEVRNGAVFSIGDKGYYFGGKDGMDVRSNSLIEFSKESSRHEISISPNPSCSDLRIESEKGFDRVRLYTMDGRLVFENLLNQPTNSLVFSLDGLALGSYLLQAGEVQVKTLIRMCAN